MLQDIASNKLLINSPLNIYLPPRCKNADSLTEIPHWSKATIAKILSQQEYLGDVINFKTRSVSYKDKTRLKNEPDDQVVFKGVHEPIIDFSLWSKVQDMKATQSNSRKSNRGIRTLFSGILICSDCGAKMNYHFDQKNPDTQYYSCSAYNRSKQECGKSHYIRLDFLTAIVIAELNRAFEYAVTCPEEFAHLVQNNHSKESDVANAEVLDELTVLLKRNQELDDIFQGLFESRATGVISDERYEKLSDSFQNQQTEIEERIKALQSKLKKVENKEGFPEKFIELASNYGHISELNRETLFPLIDFIEVFSAERSGTTQIQTIKIYYHHVGFFEIPQDIPEVSISSRKGQTLKYLPYNEYICILGSEIK